MSKTLSAALLTMGVLMTALPGAASSQPTFAEVCEAMEDYRLLPNLAGEHVWETTIALLTAVGTEDCHTAERRLLGITDLRLPELAPVETPSVLQVDFPVVVDLQVIAIATPQLIRLDLSGKVIEELSPVANLTELEALYLANTQLQDIAPLTALDKLRVLDVSYNQIVAIAPLAEMPTLRWLSLAFNPLTDLSPLGAIYQPWRQDDPWQRLDLRGLAYDLETCPDSLGDICEGNIYDESFHENDQQ
jgi:hypothetical protein